jgi:hypothetical protein
MRRIGVSETLESRLDAHRAARISAKTFCDIVDTHLEIEPATLIASFSDVP